MCEWDQARHLAGIDPVSIRNDMGSSGLPEHGLEPDHRDLSGFDEITQDHARADTGQLVDISDEQKLARRRQGFEEGVREKEIHHRGLIDDKGICLQGVFLIVTEGACARIKDQHPVDRFGIVPGQFRETLGRPTEPPEARDVVVVV